MFDIGFTELMLIGVVGLLVIGPERLPGAIRTTSMYINQIRRGFNDVRQSVQRELDNDAVMREFRESNAQLQAMKSELDSAKAAVQNPIESMKHEVESQLHHENSIAPPEASPAAPDRASTSGNPEGETPDESPREANT